MKRRIWLAWVSVALLWAAPARADNRIILRSTLTQQALQTACNPPLLPSVCTVVRPLGDPLGQLFLITSPLDVSGLLSLVGNPLGIVDAELDQLLSLVDLTSLVPSPISSQLMQDKTPTPYPTNSTTQTAWKSYVNQPAASIVEVLDAQKTFNVTGTGIVADIDTGVDPNHPVLQPVLVPGDGYDFTRSQPGGSELNDLSSCPFASTSPCAPPPCTPTTCPAPAQVNQSSAAILDQSSAAILDGNSQYKAFGHGTMVMGIIHLVAPTAMLMPLKAFHSDGTGYLSDILRAIYYGVQNKANVINMSFDFTVSSTELSKALDYANQQGVICAASAGNDGKAEIVYPAALQTDVMGVASTTDQDARSSFSNFGNSIVWVAAPGEAIVTTYPFDTYAAGWGTSFSAPFVSGGSALLHNMQSSMAEFGASAAVAHAVPLTDTGMGNGRLDLCLALESVGGTSCPPDYRVSATPLTSTITAGLTANFTISAVPLHGSTQTVMWSCTGQPAAATCTVSPSSLMLDGTHTATATVALKTTARAMSPPLLLPRATPRSPRQWLRLGACFAWIAFLLVVCFPRLASRQRHGLVAAAGLIAVSLCAYSCGGGYSGPPPGSPTLSSVGVNPPSVAGGTSSTGTVTLSGPAPSGGALVYLTSSGSAATVPASVTVAAGASSATFTVSTSAVTTSTQVTISASYGATVKTTSLTVNPTTTGGTPAGTYTLTITGTSGNLSHSTTVQVTVN